MSNKNKTVFVGVSGGVDSSVSALLLKEQGYNVVGVFIRTWTPSFIECTWRDERRDAMRVCAHLNIPFLECDAEEAYKKSVADYMIDEYRKGKTPNPDVMCNREIKFGVFWNFAKSKGADYIATGHYTQVVCVSKNTFREATGGGVPPRGSLRNGVKELGENVFLLEKSVDTSKDQSYFLWTLNQEDLKHSLFPIGHLEKKEVRNLASKYKLPTAEKKDSQGVCFLGKLDMKDFLSHYIESKEGNVLDENGKKIGNHDGALFFTLGERHGFTITAKNSHNTPYYVVDKNIKENTITVSQNKEIKVNGNQHIYEIQRTNWISFLPKKESEYSAQIRYHGEFIKCFVEIHDHNKATVTFSESILVDKGQSIVIYDGDLCLGGGIVE